MNDLPGLGALGISFETADARRPARDVVTEYYRRYEDHFGLAVVRPVVVTGVTRIASGFIVATSSPAYGDHTTQARVVVNATGTWGAPFIPHSPGARTFRGRQVHTSEYVQAEDYAGARAIVVGGGTSAVGFMLELEGIADTLTWATRRPVDWVGSENLNLEAAVAAVATQDEAARAGRVLPSIVSGTGIPVTPRICGGIDRGVLVARPLFTNIEPEGVRWPDGTFTAADVIIWATGFRPELRHLAPLKLRAESGGLMVAAGQSRADPDIFLAGYGPQASTIGANRAGRVIARQVVARLAEQHTSAPNSVDPEA